MEFYEATFQAESLTFVTFKESHLQVNEADQNRIFDSELRISEIRIKASDDHPSHPVSQGNNFSLFISFSDAEIRKKVFDLLSENGVIMFPLDENFGMVRDRFGVQWMLVP